MKTQYWKQVLCAFATTAALIGGPGAALAADADMDGIDDSVELSGGAGITFGGTNYPPCAAGVARNSCLSPTSKDIFIYLVRPAGGFLATNFTEGNVAAVFDFITRPATATAAGSGKVEGLGVGVHVAFVTTGISAANRGLVTTPSTSQKAVQIIANESPDSFVFGVADQGTPSATGDATVWPVKIKNYVVNGGGTSTDWTNFIKRTFSHELSHVAALTTLYDSRFGGNHYATGSGVVMDQSVVYNSRRKAFTIYDDYATGDKPCLLVVDTSNPSRCIGFAPPVIP